MLIEVMTEMNSAVLDLALQDAFCDFFICEGEEMIETVENYLSLLDEGKNTDEQNEIFFESIEPYIDNSILIYSSIFESRPELTVGADKQDLHKFNVGGDVTDEMKNKSRKMALKKVTGQPVTETEELEMYESVGNKIVDAAKSAIKTSKEKASSAGKSIAKAVSGGIASVKKKVGISAVPENLIAQDLRRDSYSPMHSKAKGLSFKRKDTPAEKVGDTVKKVSETAKFGKDVAKEVASRGKDAVKESVSKAAETTKKAANKAYTSSPKDIVSAFKNKFGGSYKTK